MATRQAPWRVLRPFSQFPLRPDIPNLVNQTIITILVAYDWINSINPGDQIEFVDSHDLHVWVRGTAISLEKVAVRNISDDDNARSLSKLLIVVCTDSGSDCSLLERLRVLYDDDSITEDNVVAVIRVLVSDTDIPLYKVD